MSRNFLQDILILISLVTTGFGIVDNYCFQFFMRVRVSFFFKYSFFFYLNDIHMFTNNIYNIKTIKIKKYLKKT